MTKEQWKGAVKFYLASLPVGTVMTVNGVRDLYPPPEGVDPRNMGGFFHKWENIGYAKNPRKECHGRPIAIFQKVEE